VKRHGEDAPIEAAMRADAMLEKGDLDGGAVWKRIVRAVEEMQRTGRLSAKCCNNRFHQGRNRPRRPFVLPSSATGRSHPGNLG
jgi:hypothetical protein